MEGDRALYYVTNNFNCICEDCLDDYKECDLYQPVFKEVLRYGECEQCGYSEIKEIE